MYIHRLRRHALLLLTAAAPFLLATVPPVTADESEPQSLAAAQAGDDEGVDDIESSLPRRTPPMAEDLVVPPPLKPQPEPPEQEAPPEAPPATPAEEGQREPGEVTPSPETADTGQPPVEPPADAPGVVEMPAPGEAEPEEDIPIVDSLLEPVEAKPLRLLGREVLPGESARLAWSPNTTIAGLTLPTPVLVVNGEQAGPTLCLTAAIHGDELNGIEIVRRVVYDLEPAKLSGRVIGVPIVNVQGFQQGSRYLPDRRDLNRHFPGSPNGSLADRVAHSLFSDVIRHCDLLVDIHTGSLKRTNLPQLRADMNHPGVAEFTLGFDAMAVVHSTGSPGMLRTAAVEADIVAVTMEAGESLRIQEDQIKAGVHSLTSLMERQGMISRLFVWGKPEPVYYNSEWIRAGHGGILFSEVSLGERVSQGQVLGMVADPITNAQYPIRATASGRVIGMAVDQVVMAGFAAYHIGSEAETPAAE